MAAHSKTESIPLARPEIGAREEELVLEVIEHGPLSLGPMVERFERDFKDWLGSDDAVAVSSGTSALHLGVRALGWEEGEEVLTTPLTFVASANCLLYEGVRPVFCDVDPVTCNIDPAAAAAAAGPKTVGILPVHIFGYPAAMPELEELAGRHNLGLLEDACQALGAVDSEGQRVGTRGNLAAFAFYGNKQLTTGEGGMLMPTSPTQAEELRSARNQGRDPDMKRIEHARLGFNYRLPELAAALGVAQLEKIDSMLNSRGEVAARYAEGLTGIEGLGVPVAGRGAERRSWFVYVVQLPVGTDRNATAERLRAEGIETKAYLPCIHRFEHLRRLGYREGDFPVAEGIAARSLALPFFPSMSESQVERVCAALAGALR